MLAMTLLHLLYNLVDEPMLLPHCSHAVTVHTKGATHDSPLTCSSCVLTTPPLRSLSNRVTLVLYSLVMHRIPISVPPQCYPSLP
ncbi:hypothetical protein B0J12DRAFT_343915 [Macrophomina phaseolina]|uniref:Secreted protein n=1 Tax=Macrophomina phaseolina TaxID=35725 RepID=A0ABQ8GQB1_9PEZI|nr:hypothetical protein B0J12DRAFT_343915 [Macrophomina phaseolina]